MRRVAALALVAAAATLLLSRDVARYRQNAAVSICIPGTGGMTLMWVNPEVPRSEVRRVVAHEAVHAVQNVGGCERTKDAAHKLDLEAEAFCAELKVLESDGFPAPLALEHLTDELWQGYDAIRSMPRDSARTAILRHCLP